jgi:hypothetical protein
VEVQWILGGHPLTLVGHDPSPHLGSAPDAEDLDLRRQLTDLGRTPPPNGYSLQTHHEEKPPPGPPVEHRITMVQTGPNSWRIFADRRQAPL